MLIGIPPFAKFMSLFYQNHHLIPALYYMTIQNLIEGALEESKTLRGFVKNSGLPFEEAVKIWDSRRRTTMPHGAR